MPSSVERVLLDLGRTFDRRGLRWYVFGAQAVVAAGVARFTADVDVTVEAPPGGGLALLADLADRFEPRPVPELEGFVQRTRVLPLVHRATGLPVDVVLAGPGLEERFLARAVRRRMGRREIPFLAPSDLVALKILAGRPKDLEDAAALLRLGPSGLDPADVRATLSELATLLDDPELLARLDRLLPR